MSFACASGGDFLAARLPGGCWPLRGAEVLHRFPSLFSASSFARVTDKPRGALLFAAKRKRVWLGGRKAHQLSGWPTISLTPSYILPQPDPFLPGNYRLLFQIRYRFVEFPAVQLQLGGTDCCVHPAWAMECVAVGSSRRMLPGGGVLGCELEATGRDLRSISLSGQTEPA